MTSLLRFVFPLLTAPEPPIADWYVPIGVFFFALLTAHRARASDCGHIMATAH
jgi:hypothetical protein